MWEHMPRAAAEHQQAGDIPAEARGIPAHPTPMQQVAPALPGVKTLMPTDQTQLALTELAQVQRRAKYPWDNQF